MLSGYFRFIFHRVDENDIEILDSELFSLNFKIEKDNWEYNVNESLGMWGWEHFGEDIEKLDEYDPKRDQVFEVIGKITLHFHQDYYGEVDVDEEFGEISARVLDPEEELDYYSDMSEEEFAEEL